MVNDREKVRRIRTRCALWIRAVARRPKERAYVRTCFINVTFNTATFVVLHRDNRGSVPILLCFSKLVWERLARISKRSVSRRVSAKHSIINLATAERGVEGNASHDDISNSQAMGNILAGTAPPMPFATNSKRRSTATCCLRHPSERKPQPVFEHVRERYGCNTAEAAACSRKGTCAYTSTTATAPGRAKSHT